eukprot:243330_1
MSLSLSAVASIAYFSVYITMIIILAIWVWKNEEHKLDRTFLKSVWSQRTIYASVIVHFYDTATDIGVLITWYNLYYNEMHGTNYKTVDMSVFFWGGCSVLLFYRFVTFLLIIYQQKNEEDPCRGICIRAPLAIFDLFIFEGIYQSFKSAENILTANQKKLQQRQEKMARQKQRRLQLEEEIKRLQALRRETDDDDKVIVWE